MVALPQREVFWRRLVPEPHHDSLRQATPCLFPLISLTLPTGFSSGFNLTSISYGAIFREAWIGWDLDAAV